jgi:hypothetical protein
MSYQQDVMRWGDYCFGKEINRNGTQRNHRFIEEAFELVQSTGMSRNDIITVLDYVYNRPVGDTFQEVGGVMVSLAALCELEGVDMTHASNAELDRCWRRSDIIREKQKTKPTHD